MWHEPKTVLGRIWITWNVYIGEEEWLKTNDQRYYLKKLYKQEQIWSKVSKRKKIKNQWKMKDINDKVNEKKLLS